LKPATKGCGRRSFPGNAKTEYEALGFYEADDFVKTRWKFVSFYF